MVDMNALERQLADESLRIVGPARRVDDLAIFESVTAANRQKRWGFTMFSALKFIAAGVIVALFGGFLLAGILTPQQGDEVAPAAVTESPSPMTTEALLSGMVTEEVEPGVLRVLDDGVRDPTLRVRGYPGATVDVTPDGGVWLSGDEGRQGVFRLGDEQVFEDRVGSYREVAPDGSLWGIGDVSDSVSGIYSFAREGWTLRATTTDDDLQSRALAIGPDGTVWLTAMDFDKHCPDTESGDCFGTDLLRVEDDGSVTTVADWSGVYNGDVAYDEVAVSPDGDVWLIGVIRLDGPEAEALLRFDGEAWQVIPGPEGFLNHYAGRSMAFGGDGTLWVNTNHPEDDWQERGGDWRVGGLARFDDPGWTVFTEADGVEDWGGQGFIATDLLSVAPDGSLWMNGIDDISGCDGVDHYDGTTWTSYLRKACVHDLAIAPDGSVWVRADVEAGSWNATSYDVGLYVITPAAVTAKEGAVADPQSTEALLAGMVTEEIEPGVFRVDNDGVRDLRQPSTGLAFAEAVFVDGNGHVWRVIHERDGRPASYFRLGAEGERFDGDPIDLAAAGLYVKAAPDGGLMTFGSALADLRERTSATTETFGLDIGVPDIAVQDDGTVWLLDRHVGDLMRAPPDGEPVAARWTDVYDGMIAGFAVTPQGEAWLMGASWEPPNLIEVFLRFDGTDWEVVPAPADLAFMSHGVGIDVGPDGTLWAVGDSSSPHRSLARYDGAAWTIFDEGEGVHPWGSQRVGVYGAPADMLRVAPDASVWVNEWGPDRGGCGGLGRFDSRAWSSFLPGMCVLHFDFAPDGAVWVVAQDERSLVGEPGGSGVQTFVITPEAVD